MAEYNQGKTIDDCLNLIECFVKDKKYLNGNIENLKSFNFEELEEGSDYRKTTCSYFDADDTELARAIYFAVWKDELPDLTFEEIGTGKKYRGDTLNTFHTLFGKKIDSFQKLEKYSNSESIKKYAKEEFYKTYQTIGNFMLLPNKKTGQTINQYRGICGWRDYFDRFLHELNECLTNDAYDNQVFKGLIMQNEFYFGKFDSIKKISKANFLEPYLNSKGVKELFFKKEPKFLLDKWGGDKEKSPLAEESKQEYTEFAEIYISKATEIINYRADKIICKLKSVL